MAHILVVDDDKEMRELLEILLTDEGYEVEIAASPSSALDLVRTRQPDLIFLDLRMQGQTGENFVHQYRALPNASAALVLLSAAGDLEQVACRLDVDNYLSKPFDLDDLLAIVTEALAELDQSASHVWARRVC